MWGNEDNSSKDLVSWEMQPTTDLVFKLP
jgi:hypothetical protein